jgi:hypothetical protein
MSIESQFGYLNDLQTLRPSLRQLAARALATSVLPVPGGPWKSTPLGGVTPKLWNMSGYSNGSNVISFNLETSTDG